MKNTWILHFTSISIRALTLIAKFILMLCLVKYFKPSELGLYGLLTACLAYILFFLGLEFYNYTARKIVNGNSLEQTVIIRDAFILYAIIFTLLLPCFFLLFYMHIIPQMLLWYFFIIMIVEHISNELMRILLFLSRQHIANTVFFIRQGLWIILLLPIFYWFPESRNLNTIAIAWFLGAALSICIACIYLYHLPWKIAIHQKIHWIEIWNGLKISRPFLITAFCALNLLYVERFFINYYCGLNAVGTYTLYSGLCIAIYTLINAGVSKMLLPELISSTSKKGNQSFQTIFHHMLQYTLIVTILLVVLSACCIYPFLRIVHKTVYLENIQVFYILLLGTIFRSVSDVPIYGLYAQHRDHLLLWVNLASFCILLLCNVILTPLFGIIGSAMSSTFTVFFLLLSAFFSLRYL